MKTIGEIKELQEFIKNNQKETFTLEYKESGKLINIHIYKNKKDIMETISAFANSKGGVMIIGVGLSNGEYVLDDGIDLSQFNENRIRDLIDGNISPKIEKINITQIPKSPDKAFYIIEIAEGETAHQSLLDKIYYGRFGEKDEPLEDHWVRMLMFKEKYPKLSLKFEKIYKAGSLERLEIRIANDGQVVSKSFGFNLYLLKDDVQDITWRTGKITQVKEYRDPYTIFQYRTFIDPNCPELCPGDEYLLTNGNCRISLNPNNKSKLKVKYEIFSENPEKIEGEIEV